MSDFTDSLQGLPQDVAQQFQQLHDSAAAGSSSSSASASSMSARSIPRLNDPRLWGPAPQPQSFKNDPTEGMGTIDRTLAGIGQGMTNVARHAGNLVGLVPDQALQESQQQDAPLLNTPAGRRGSTLGTMAAFAPISMAAGAGLGALGNSTASGALPMLARAAASPIGQGIAQGATQGAILADPGARGQGALLGGAAGAILPAAGQGVSTFANGLSRTPAAQQLLDRGISLTPGQMNPTGAANRMEQALEGVPGVGDLVQNAREGAIKQYQRAMVQDAMAPGATLSGKGDFNGMIDEAARSFDPAYDAGKGFPLGAKIVNTTGADVPLSKAFQSIASSPRLGLDASTRANLGQQLTDQLREMTAAAVKSGTGLQSDDLLGLRSIIRQAARDENGETAASRATRSFWNDAEGKVTQALNSQLPPAASQALQAADQQYAKFAIVRNVAKATKDAPNGPTPIQFSNAIAQATDANTYARGGGLNRDFAKAARDTFQANVPRTGLAGAGRLVLPALAAKMAAPFAAAHPLIAGASAAPMVGMAGLTLTAPGRALAAGNTGLQKMLQGGLMNLQSLPQPAQSLVPLYSRQALVNGLLQ